LRDQKAYSAPIGALYRGDAYARPYDPIPIIKVPLPAVHRNPERAPAFHSNVTSARRRFHTVVDPEPSSDEELRSILDDCRSGAKRTLPGGMTLTDISVVQVRGKASWI